MKKSKSFLERIKPVAIGSAMADIALLLIVFFMATISEPPKGDVVELPVAETQSADLDCFYLTLGKSGNIYFENQKVTLQELYDSLAMRVAERDKVVAFSADRDMNYKEVAIILTVLQELEFLNVVFMSQPKEADK